MPVPFVSIPAAVLFFRYREGRIGRERNRYFINQYLFISLFNCIGFSDVGLPGIGKSNIGLPGVGFSNIGQIRLGFT